ncbi:MAG: winged helix-turn-helix domain-containing protein [Clostridiaceae bacterium]|jgi:CRP-like cAMP-binding protein|nr:winged helix-turn-helix domain-containing protein [Clostridiaceae bacterium]
MLNITRKVLAESSGVEKTSLSRELAKMRDADLIKHDTKSIETIETY